MVKVIGALFGLLLSATGALAQQCGTVSTCPSISTPPNGTELLYVVQQGVSKKATLGQLGSFFGTVAPGLAGQVAYYPQNSSALAGASGDCGVAGGVLICTKSSGVAFGTAAFQNIGTSGSNVPLLSQANVWGAVQTLPSPNFTGTVTGNGTIPNAVLANSSTTVNGQTCTLGSTCTITASAGTITVGATTIASGTPNGLLYDNAGVLGNLASANNGVLATNGSGVPGISATIPSAVLANLLGATTVNLNATASGSLPAALAGTISRTFQVDGAVGRVESDAAGNIPVFTTARFDGTAAAPVAVGSGVTLGSFSNAGYDGAALSVTAGWVAITTEAWTAAHHGSKSCLSTTPTGTIATAASLCQENDGGVYVGAVTGASKGANTLNAALYHNGTILGTAATQNTGTSGGTIPLLNAANVWSALQSFGSGDLSMAGTAHGVVVSENAAAAVTTAAGTNGQILTGQTGADPAWETVSGDCTFTQTGALTCTKTNGVTYPSSGTSGGALYFNSTSSVASSALLAANALVVGGGAGSAPATITLGGDCTLTSPNITCTKTNGVTYPSSGTSGGILGFTASGTVASSAALTANAIVLGGGAGATPTALGSLGTATTLLHGNAAGAPTFAAASLTADVTGTLPVANGGLGIASGTSGGILGFTASGTLASSVALTQHALTIGGGAGATPTPLASLGTSTTVLHGAAAGDPTFGAVSLTADVTGTLPVGNGGTGATAFTLGSAVFAGASGVYTQDNANYFWDATNHRLGIGTAAPQFPLSVSANAATPAKPPAATNVYIVGADVVLPRLTMDGYGASTFPVVQGRAAQGTAAAPTASQNANTLFQFGAAGYGATAFSASQAAINFTGTENWSDTAQGTSIIFGTTKNTTTTRSNVLTLDGYGHAGFAGPSAAVPSITGCGTSPSAARGSDTAGEVTEGTTATGCTVTFANAYTTAPYCVVTTQSQLVSFAYSISTTAITIVNTSTTGDKINWICHGT